MRDVIYDHISEYIHCRFDESHAVSLKGVPSFSILSEMSSNGFTSDNTQLLDTKLTDR
jgi:hypothetical protein